MTKTIVLDGGMGRELEQMGAPFRQPEWSALALMETPELVRTAHENFIASGAEVITTNCYAVIPFHIGQERFDEQGRDLIALSAKLAREAVNNSGKNVKVAGCIPPIFGSYCPDRFYDARAPERLAAFIQEQAPYVDLWLGETLSSRREALAITNALATHGNTKPLWLSYCLSEDEPLHLRSGVELEDVVQFTCDETPAEALLYNCCAIEDIEEALLHTRKILPRDMMLGAYPNAFVKTPDNLKANKDLNALRDDITPGLYAEYAQKWIANGADIIGGCCGISPAHIAAVRAKVS